MAYENFYEGADSNLNPGSDNVYAGKFKVVSGVIGGTTSVQTANQIQEVNNLLNTGMKAIEVSTIDPSVFEMIPKEHFKEINNLAKLNNAEITLHAPLIDPQGFSQQGWSEQNREANERQMAAAVLRAHELSPNKPIPVTFHASGSMSSGVPGIELTPTKLVNPELLTEEEKRNKPYTIVTENYAVNQETGELQKLKRDIRYDPGEGKRIWTAETQLKAINSTDWINRLTNVETHLKQADEAMASGGGNMMRAGLFLNDAETSFRTLFDRAAKHGTEKSKQVLNEISNSWKEFSESHPNLERPEEMHMQAQLLTESIHKLSNLGGEVKLFKPVEEFAREKAGKTFSNVAFEAWSKYKDSAPIISIENPPAGMAISSAADLKALIEESRKQLAKKLMEKEGKSSDEAKRIAEGMIGATWDTSHISMIRKQGFGADQLVKEAETIAPFVKHVHLNDNFGYTHTDLPFGMGNVPMKEVVEKLQARGAKDKKMILEGGGFFQHFKTSPHSMMLEATNSPLYSSYAQPTWKRMYGTMGNYSSGYGSFLPEQHQSTYGGGFSGLPTELGGSNPGRQSRFSGTPNQ